MIELSAFDTYQFVKSVLPQPAQTILEVGALPHQKSYPAVWCLGAIRSRKLFVQEQERRKRVLGWRRTHNDPFAGEWEQITSWLIANPERSSHIPSLRSVIRVTSETQPM